VTDSPSVALKANVNHLRTNEKWHWQVAYAIFIDCSLGLAGTVNGYPFSLTSDNEIRLPPVSLSLDDSHHLVQIVFKIDQCKIPIRAPRIEKHAESTEKIDTFLPTNIAHGRALFSATPIDHMNDAKTAFV
jgi:hypothetical protein